MRVLTDRSDLEHSLGQAPPAQRGSLQPRPGLDGPAPPLEECLDGFWSPGLSPARLRALAAAPAAAAPDLLLRMFPPPPVTVRGKDHADVLTPAYQRLAADQPEHAEPRGNESRQKPESDPNLSAAVKSSAHLGAIDLSRRLAAHENGSRQRALMRSSCH